MSMVAAAIILAAMAGVAADVFGRYFFGRPIAWVFEITEYALLYVPCLGMAWLAREGGHVAIDSFVSKLPPSAQHAMYLATTAACALVCFVIAYWGTVVVVARYRQGTIVDQMIRTPEFLILWVIPFGFGLAAVEFTRLFVLRRRIGAAA
jgi:TRAP-type C4-dicarboxylate transport system permease small subunit